MFNPVDFVSCIRENLKEKRYGHKRIAEIIKDYEARAAVHVANGKRPVDAGTLAMKETFERMSEETLERVKRTSKMLSVQAENNALIASAMDVDVKVFTINDMKGKQKGARGSRGAALGRAAVSLIEDDPRFNGLSYNTNKETNRQQLYAIFGDVLDKMGKGAFGRQKGKAHLDNVIHEISGTKTGDSSAKEFADAWLKVQDLAVDMFNQAGGSMKRLNKYIPQKHNAVRISRAGEGAWVKDHLDNLDWNQTRWPNGKMIEPEDRSRFLGEVFATKSTDGANKIDDKAFRGQGRAVGNLLDQNRLLHYKGAQSWLDMHNKYGDGSVFDVFVRHIEDLSHRVALIETFGPNPELTAMNIRSIVRKQAAGLSAREKNDADAVLKNKFDPMLETVMRDNPMNPESILGNTTVGTSNILTSAQLASAVFLAVPGDFMQTAAVRALNNMGMFDGVGFYVKSLATDPAFMKNIATQSGFIMDEVVMATYSQTRFTGLATHGPAISRRISESVMRASLMSGHTKSARWAVQAEFMGMMNRVRKDKFEDLPFKHVMQRYGITPEEWDVFRNNAPTWNPRKDVEFMRPIDLMDTELPNRQMLFKKLQGMITEESRRMVPEATIEGAVTLKDTTRPDTLVGALLYSFAMYKNFPVSFQMIYGRLGMTSSSVKGRLGFYAGLGAGMTMVGALGTQMREISKGRDPMPMDNAKFFGKAMLSGGALSIYGDFLFAGVNEYGRGPAEQFAGPIAGFLGDTTDLVLGDVFQWADTVGGLDDDFDSKFGAKAVSWAKRYTPGTSLWWARLALERQVFDRMQEIADPKVYRKRRAQKNRMKRDRGNTTWWDPGSRTPDRLPQYGE